MRFFKARVKTHSISQNGDSFLQSSENTQYPIAVVEKEMSTPNKGDVNMSNPLLTLSETELRDLCRHRIDAFENWSRRLLDEIFKKNYGENYFDFRVAEGQPLVKKEIRSRIEKRVQDNPGRFPRKIDAILIEDIEYFLCRDDLYGCHFKGILEPFYSGIAEVRQTLNRLIPIRNKLSHGNTISTHEAEQCLCYTGDFIAVFKTYYQRIGRERDYNVPVFLRIKDCLGNDIIRKNPQSTWDLYLHGIDAPRIQLRSGDQYKLWVEVDSSFDSSFYEIWWAVLQCYSPICSGTGSVIEFTLTDKNVSYSPTLHIELTTKREWHRFQKCDDIINLHYEEVLPPVEDSY